MTVSDMEFQADFYLRSMKAGWRDGIMVCGNPVCDLGLDSGTAGDHGMEFAAKALMDRGKDFSLCEVTNTVGIKRVRDLDRCADTLFKPLSFDVRPTLFIDGLHKQGHAVDHGWMDLLHITHRATETFGEGYGASA